MKNRDYNRWGASSWKSIVDGEPAPVALLGVDHRVIYANIALAQLFGLDPDAMRGRYCYEVFHGCTSPVQTCPHEQLLNDHQGHSAIVSIGPLRRIFHVLTTPVFDRHDVLVGVLHVSHDVTAFVEREEALQAMCEELERRVETRTRELAERLLIERLESSLLLRFGEDRQAHMELGVLVGESVDEIAKVLGYDRCSFWEVRGDVARVMGAYERRADEFPALPKETTRERDGWMFVEPGDGGERGRSSLPGINRCVAASESSHADDPSFLLLAECHAERTYCGASMRPEHVQLLCHLLADIVRRVQVGARRLALETQLAQADRIARLGQLTAGLAHEISQPLSAALCNAQSALKLLDRSKPDLAESLAALKDIIANIRHAGDVMHRTRALYKGEFRPYAPVSLERVTRSVLKMMEGALAAEEVHVEFSVAPSLPCVDGDEVQMQQVVVNLIRNAVDAVRGRSDRQIRVTLDQAESRQVQLKVQDTGAGIFPGREEVIFRSFETTKTDGMGMGLAICREIVAKHKGTIRAFNAPSGGAVFCVTLPGVETQA